MSAVPKWQAGHLYLPGDIVQPVQVTAGGAVDITNSGFETGDATGWTLPSGAAVVSGAAYAGTYRVEFTGTGGDLRMLHDAVAVEPGKSISASAMYQQGAASAGDNPGRIVLAWFDASSAEITAAESLGNIVSEASNGAWKQSSVTGTAPAGAAFVAIGFRTTRNDGNASSVDQFTWNLATTAAQSGLIYKAVQPDPGTSAGTEPVWPTTLGVQVIDNTVTWEAISATRVTWEAAPILLSGTIEPTWPTEPGAFIVDGTIQWECFTRRVEDENCPNTKVVQIIASKVFAVDEDIVRFSATANPLDWTSEQDAGYLPTGLQSGNANYMSVLQQYRSNLVAFSASSFQNWQVDPDPAAMALLDQMEGIGSTWYKAAQPVANDLLFLSNRGVRSIGIAAANESLAAGDVGEPIDVLVRAAMRVATINGTKALSTYYPGAGQYWLTFSDYPPPGIAVTGDVPDSTVGDSVSGNYTATGGVGTKTYAVTSGTFPAGLTLASTGAYSGTAEGEGGADPYWDYAWVVTATDEDGNTATVADGCRVSNFALSGDVPDGRLFATTTGTYTNAGGIEPITYAVTAGTFPPGLTLDTDGSYSGDYTTSGDYSWTVTGTDSNGNIATLDDTATVGVGEYWNVNDRTDEPLYYANITNDTRDFETHNDDPSFTRYIECRGVHSHATGSVSELRYFEIEVVSRGTVSTNVDVRAGLMNTATALTGLSGSYGGNEAYYTASGSAPLEDEFSSQVHNTCPQLVPVGGRVGILVNLLNGAWWPTVDGVSPTSGANTINQASYPNGFPGGALGGFLSGMTIAPMARVYAQALTGSTSIIKLRLHQYADELLYLPVGASAWVDG